MSTSDSRIAGPGSPPERARAAYGASAAAAAAPPAAAPSPAADRATASEAAVASSDADAGAARPRGARLAALRRIPLAGYVCALVAVVNAVCWSVISPPFELPDEPSHYAYVQHLAETGHLPTSNSLTFPQGEELVLRYLLQPRVQFAQETHTIASVAQQQLLEGVLELPLPRDKPGGGGMAAAEPPLYYSLETLPYALGSGGDILDRLALMRLLSALMGGLTALLAFLFLREALPGERWTWTVGGLGVALTPVLGMMSGAVNPDALLFCVSSGLLYCIARAFRRGLTRRGALVLGGVIGAGCVTKLIFLGLVPGALAALVVLALRAARASGLPARRWLVPALLLAAAPPALYLAIDALSLGSVTLKFFAGGALEHSRHTSLGGAISYMWQFYLFRLPGMSPALHGVSGARAWFEQIVGKYGWLDTTFPSWVVTVALVPAALLAVLFARGLARGRRALWIRRTELAVYALMALGLMALIAMDDYRSKLTGEYIQLRYLMPMVAMLGVGLALAARGAGRRWGPVAGACIVLLVLAHDLFSQLLVVGRYYG